MAVELAAIESEPDLVRYLTAQTKLRAQDFIEAGISCGKPFDEVYRTLQKKRLERGLSNSEAATASALWAAAKAGANISHIALAEHFPPNGAIRNSESLAAALRAADGIIVASPVYFGDRGSLVQSLFEFIAADVGLKREMSGKVYGGLAVGAKRNGGQETTLIYQMLDMLNAGFLAVGNGHETTAQYGGTVKAGDVGTFAADEYGLETCLGTGRRVARISQMRALGRSGRALSDKLSIHLWLVQDTNEREGYRFFQDWMRRLIDQHPGVKVRLFDTVSDSVVRCLACEVCPTHLGDAREYRCIVSSADDFFVKHHKELIGADAILMCAYSPADRSSIRSVYQSFIERTRYLRRDNYVFEDILVAPFIVSDIEARQNLHIRAATSLIRHHTVLHRPLIAYQHCGQTLNAESLTVDTDTFVSRAGELAIGRYLQDKERVEYRPVGYHISAARVHEERKSGRLTEVINRRLDDRRVIAKRRLGSSKSSAQNAQ